MAAVAAFLMTVIGCGQRPEQGDEWDEPKSYTLTVSISSPPPFVHAGSAVNLRAEASGFTATKFVTWWVQESHDKDLNDDCGIIGGTAPPPTVERCPYGYVTYATSVGTPNYAIYYASLTPGTYHVTARVMQGSKFDSVEKLATVAITVSP